MRKPQENLVMRPNSGREKNYTEDELTCLTKMNDLYTHVTFGSTSEIYSKSYGENGYVNWEKIPKNIFGDRFLHLEEICYMNAGIAWLSWKGKSHKKGVYFYPKKGEVFPFHSGRLNTFLGFAVEPKNGDVSPFLDLVERYICQEDKAASKYLLDWCAHLVQVPWEKPTVSVVLTGEQGTGKGTFAEALLMIMGGHGKPLNGPGLLTGKFNSVVDEVLLIFADEVSLVDKKHSERLKPIISEKALTVEPKNKEARSIRNYTRLIFASNDKRVLNAGAKERRYFVLETSSKIAQNHKYFDKYSKWLHSCGPSKLLYYLQQRDISGFNPRQAPRTTWLRHEILSGLDIVDQYIMEELSRQKPFGVDNFVEPSAIVARYRSFLPPELPNISTASGRSVIGKKLKSLNVKKIETYGKTYYDIRAIDEMKQQFVDSVGLELEDAFEY
jgi:putative DNA primase/helicase